jgi:hypothetical protein
MMLTEKISYFTKQREVNKDQAFKHFNIETIFEIVDKKKKLEILRPLTPVDMQDLREAVFEWHMCAGQILDWHYSTMMDLRDSLTELSQTEGAIPHEDPRVVRVCSEFEYSTYIYDKQVKSLFTLAMTAVDAVRGLPAHVSVSTRKALFKALLQKAMRFRFRHTMPRVLVKGLPAILCGKDA